MAQIKPRTPRGMRDFLPADMHKREYVYRVVREVFESFGFEPISTPVMELRAALLGNYGEDAEKLIYEAKHSEGKEELAMRYDLTVPLSRFFAEHENDLPMPFRRYHIAPVWRGERPGRGRYREFVQCDADIVGVRSTAADAECVSVVYTVLTRLGFADFTIKMNTRKLLTAIGIYAGVPEDQLGDLYRSIDKSDKIGLEGVAKELIGNGMPPATVDKMVRLLQPNLDSKDEVLAYLKAELADIEAAQEGIQELEDLVRYTRAFGVPDDKTALDFTMVRGLGYYTGSIFETIITEPENLGSVSGGGRYDELIGLFRYQSLPTTGISLGIERIIDLMDQLDLYPPSVRATALQVLVTTFSEDLLPESMRLATELRAVGINAEVYLDDRKGLGKQLGYADGKGVPMAAILGADELAQGVVTLKRLADRHEATIARDALAETIREWLVG